MPWVLVKKESPAKWDYGSWEPPKKQYARPKPYYSQQQYYSPEENEYGGREKFFMNPGMARTQKKMVDGKVVVHHTHVVDHVHPTYHTHEVVHRKSAPLFYHFALRPPLPALRVTSEPQSLPGRRLLADSRQLLRRTTSAVHGCPPLHPPQRRLPQYKRPLPHGPLPTEHSHVRGASPTPALLTPLQLHDPPLPLLLEPQGADMRKAFSEFS